MTHDLKLTLSRSASMISTFPDEMKNNLTPDTAYEVFRNNTTAVEVIVKEVPKKKKKEVMRVYEDQDLERLQELNESLANDLKHSNIRLQTTRDNFKILIGHMKKQLDEAYLREVEIQRKYLNLQLESEKLKSLFESKTNLIARFKREMNYLKRVIKFVVKGISFTPSVFECRIFDSDAEYESDHKKEYLMKFVPNVVNNTALLEMNISED